MVARAKMGDCRAGKATSVVRCLDRAKLAPKSADEAVLASVHGGLAVLSDILAPGTGAEAAKDRGRRLRITARDISSRGVK